MPSITHVSNIELNIINRIAHYENLRATSTDKDEATIYDAIITELRIIIKKDQ